VFGVADQASMTAGPALAGVLTAVAGPAVALAVDAATWAVLAVSYARVAPLVARMSAAPSAAPAPAPGVAERSGAWAVIRSSPVLPGLLVLSFFYYLLYGPVEVALPVHVAGDLHGSATLLGMFWVVFGVGAIIGELAAPFLRRLPVWPTMTAIVLGWGLALVPLGLPVPLWAALGALFIGALFWGPWLSLSMAVFQQAAPPEALAQVLAARGSLLILASPLGTALGGPIVTALGARGTLLASALSTVALGLVTASVLAGVAYRRRFRAVPEPLRS
jgi:hypothetical protein